MGTRGKWICLTSRKLIFIGGVIFALLIAAGVLIHFISNSPSENKLTGEDYLPVNAPLSSDIKFSAEKIRPELTGQDYFVNYRLERDKFRQETKEMLSVLLDSRMEQTQLQAQQKWLALSQSIKLEGETESVLKMKGFDDVVANVNSDSVNVMILTSSLTPEQVALIQDVVIRVTGVRIDKIYISTKK